MPNTLPRRSFIAGFALSAGAVSIGLYAQGPGPRPGGAPPSGGGPPSPPKDFRTFVKFRPDGGITLINPQTEMGQGVYTTLPMMLADELDIDFAAADIEVAPNGPAFVGWRGQQLTAASRSIRFWYPEFRKMGGVARGLFIEAAARQWGVPADRLDTAIGKVVDPASGRSASYQSLLASIGGPGAAAKPRPIPVDRYRYVGKDVARRDLEGKVDGSAQYAADLRFPGMLYAAAAMSPYFDTASVSFDAKAALACPGMVDIRRLGDGVLAVAEHWWHARKALDAAKLHFVPNAKALFDSTSLEQAINTGHSWDKAVIATDEGDMRRLDKADAVVEQAFDFPFLAHACMEPLSGTARLAENGVLEVYAPTQSQQTCAQQVVDATGLALDKVVIRPMLIGGGFGRKISDNRAAVQAAQLALALKRPVHVQWTREDDIRRDRYRPAVSVKLRAGLTGDGLIDALAISVSGPSLSKSAGMPLRDGVDIHAVAGLAETPYRDTNLRVGYNDLDTPVPLAFWRAVGDSHNPFARECFMDIAAQKAGLDPAEFRRRNLKDDPRMLRVLNTLVEASDWKAPRTKNRYKGIAIEAALGSYTGQVVEIEILPGQRIVTRKIWAVLDCGMAMSRNTIAAQVEGGIVFALAAAWHGRISFEQGQVRESNFHDYRMTRLADTPAIETIILPSDEEPTGVGEIGVPPTGPALANAIRGATGVSLNAMPFSKYTDELRGALASRAD